jgi:putative tryptophan/tyrosine transport system substrate-binding protein
MRRIGLAVVLAVSVILAPLAAEAQEAAKIHRIAFLGSTSPGGYASQMKAFREGLHDLGYIKGKNPLIEFRWAEGKYERLPELAAELVRLKPDVLVTHGAPGSLAAKAATNKSPSWSGSLARPLRSELSRPSHVQAGMSPGRLSFSLSSTPNG